MYYKQGGKVDLSFPSFAYVAGALVYFYTLSVDSVATKPAIGIVLLRCRYSEIDQACAGTKAKDGITYLPQRTGRPNSLNLPVQFVPNSSRNYPSKLIAPHHIERRYDGLLRCYILHSCTQHDYREKLEMIGKMLLYIASRSL